MVWPQSMNWGDGARVDLRAFMKKKITGNHCPFCYRKQRRFEV